MGLSVTQPQPEFRAFMQFVKMDAAKREVAGILTAEKPDKTGEILDYHASKPYFKAWSDEISKATYDPENPNRHSLGNVREMHNPQAPAVGKLINLQFDDNNRSIYGVAKILDDAAWNKCANGVYTGFSIGGKYVNGKPVGGGRYVASPSEVSIVDNPALSDAYFTYVKEDGSSELRKFNLSKDHEVFHVKPANPECSGAELSTTNNATGLMVDITGQQDRNQDGSPMAPRSPESWTEDEKWVQSLTSGTYEKSDWCPCDSCRKEMALLVELWKRFGEDAVQSFVEKSASREKSGYLVVEPDGTKHLPTGYGGKPDHRLMGAAWAALHGGYRGKKYSGPDKEKAIGKLKALYAREGLKPPSEKSLLTEFDKANNLQDIHPPTEIEMTKEEIQSLVSDSVSKAMELEKGKMKRLRDELSKGFDKVIKAHNEHSEFMGKALTGMQKSVLAGDHDEDFSLEHTNPQAAISQEEGKRTGQLETPTSTISPAPVKADAGDLQKAATEAAIKATTEILKSVFGSETVQPRFSAGVGKHSDAQPSGRAIDAELRKRIEESAQISGLSADLIKRATEENDSVAKISILKSAGEPLHELPPALLHFWSAAGHRTQ